MSLVTTLAGGSWVSARSVASPVIDPRPQFRVEELARNVYLFSPAGVHGFGNDANSVAIIGDSGVLVVDAQFSATSTRAVLDSLRRRTTRPVRWVVNTHWHDDHIAGNQVYRAAFPSVEFIAHRFMREDLETEGVRIRTGFMGSIAGTAGFLRSKIDKREGIDGKPTDSTEIVAFQSYVDWIERFAAESASHVVVTPTRVFDDSLRFSIGSTPIVLRYLGRAHTRGDIVVHLPAQRIAIIGDIVLAPVPFVGTTSYPRDYAATIDGILALSATTIVPGHGSPLRSPQHLRDVQRMLVTITRQVDSMRRGGDSLATVRRVVTLSEFRKLFAGDDRLKNELFDNYVVQSAIPKAFRDGAIADSMAGRGTR
jgi:glyoxylase-like metal-dependent hydrolase (beta-lactamase superfamily II)